MFSCLDVVKYLIQVLHADATMQTSDKWTAFHYTPYLEIINYLINNTNNTDINVNNKNNVCMNSAGLHFAAYWNYKESAFTCVSMQHSSIIK